MGWSCWLWIAALAGCGRLGFGDRDGGGSGSGSGSDGATDSGLSIVTCDRPAVTTPTYWADFNLGLDTNPGTQAAPTKTITKAITLATATGGTIVVAPGNYDETLDISTTKPLLLLSAQRYLARIQRINCLSCQDLAVDGFAITGSILPLVSVNGGARITIHDNVVYGGGSAGIRVTSGAQSVIVADNVVYDTVATSLHVNVATDVTFRNNVVFDATGTPGTNPPVWLEGSTNATFAGNVVFRGRGSDTSYGVISLRATAGTTLVENNLIGGSPNATSLYASIGFDQGGGTAMIRHNTFIGPVPGAAFGLGAGNVPSGGYVLVNNLWASAGTTQPFTDGSAVGFVTLRHNLYWNAPTGAFTAGGSPAPPNDPEAITADPGLSFALPAAPTWTAPTFAGGASTTCDVHAQLVEAMAPIAATSPAAAAADPTQSPTVDIRGRVRPSPAAVGAYEP